MRFDNFIGGSYQAESSNASNERTVNFFIEPLPPSAKSSKMLLPTPGFNKVVTVPEGPIRGMYTLSDPEASTGSSPRMFFVAGIALYELFPDYTYTQRGLLDWSASNVQWACNGDAGHQLLVLSGGYGNILDLNTNTFTPHVVSNVQSCGILDGWFLALDPDTSTLSISNLLDGLVWDPTQITQRLSAADRWISFGISHRQIWLIGRQSCDVYYNSGAYPFPFQPIPDAFFTVGTASQQSMVPFGDTSDLVWLGATANGRGKVHRTQGLNPGVISNIALETAIDEYSVVSDAISFTFVMNGHSFYVMTFPTEDKTWLYDDRSGMWTEWLYFNKSLGSYESCRVGCHTLAFGKNLVGDRSTGAIYEMSRNFMTDVDGSIIRRVRQAPHLTNEGKITFYDMLRLDMQVGVGVETGQGSDPKITLEVSFDGGKTFGPAYECSVGPIGDTLRQVFWRCLGSGRDCVFRVVFADAALCQIATAYLDSHPGTY